MINSFLSIDSDLSQFIMLMLASLRQINEISKLSSRLLVAILVKFLSNIKSVLPLIKALLAVCAGAVLILTGLGAKA